MKTYEYTIKIEGLKSSIVSAAEHSGSLEVENIETASQEVINLTKRLNGEFTKFHLTLEEKS